MADNFSTSVVTLANPGDWCEWSVTLDSTDVTDLNSATARASLAIRGALSAASLSCRVAIMVNDIASADAGPGSGAYTVFSSSGSWVNNDRFGFLGSAVTSRAQTVNYPPFGPRAALGRVISPDLWVVGANTIRLLHLGQFADPTQAEPLEIDYLAIQTGPGFQSTGPSFGGGITIPGSDSVFESTPATFTSHTDPNPDGAERHLYLLKATDTIATGSLVDATTFVVVRYCPGDSGTFNARFKIEGSGGPRAGFQCWLIDTSTVVELTGTTDSNGVVTFTGLTAGDSFHFAYGGDADYGPLAVGIAFTEHVGCNGWAVGRASVGI